MKLTKIQKFILMLMLIIIVIIALYAVLVFLPNKNKANDIQVSEKIKYEYKIYERDSKLYREIFNELKNTLNSNDIDYSKYAEYITELFVIDFYSLNNKINKNDIGGLQFIKNDIKDNFILNASSTIYKYLENNDNGNRNQELPVVDTIKMNSIEKSTYKINTDNYDSYVLSLEWTYKVDLGYDNKGTFIVIKDGEKLFIVEKS